MGVWIALGLRWMLTGVVFIDGNRLVVLYALDAKCLMIHCFSFGVFSVVAGYVSLLGGADGGQWLGRVKVEVSGVAVTASGTLIVGGIPGIPLIVHFQLWHIDIFECFCKKCVMCAFCI